jgi:hypothetical protein
VPPTPRATSDAEQEAAASEAAAAELAATSSDASHSSYKAAPAEEQNPPAGPRVIQTRGVPKAAK